MKFAGRAVLAAIAVLTISSWIAGAGIARDLDSLAAEAASAGPVIWYESSPADKIQKVIDGFNERYPDVEVRHVRATGGTAVAARIIQESQAGTRTADVATTTADQYTTLANLDLLSRIDWTALGVAEKVTPSDKAAITTSPYFVLIWNQDTVSDSEAPKSWDALIETEWKGRIGAWVRAGPFVQLAEQWGVDKARDYLERFAAHEPILFQSTFPLAQQVAAGEVDLAIVAYHATLPPRDAGARLGVGILDPTPVIGLYSYSPKKAGNSAGAQLLLAWLHSAEGASVYEASTGRGSHLVEGTMTYQALSQTRSAVFPPEKSDEVTQLTKEFNAILGKVGQAQ